MKMPDLLVRGMLAGIIASVLATGFAFAFGEPAIEGAIAVEEATAAAAPAMPAGHDHSAAAGDAEAPSVSREVQRTVGLFTGMLALGIAFGGLFAIVFAVARGRLGITSDRGTAFAVALLTFLALYLVPFLTYPANPPAVGHAETITARTSAYLATMLVSVLLTVAAVALHRRLAATRSGWDAAMIVGAVFGIAATAFALTMPAFREVPKAFPADVLWQFRIASIGTQLTLWCGIGLAFGLLTERAARRQPARA